MHASKILEVRHIAPEQPTSRIQKGEKLHEDIKCYGVPLYLHVFPRSYVFFYRSRTKCE